MPLRLGIPDDTPGTSLTRRLAWITGARLVFLLLTLGLLGVFFLKSSFTVGSQTVRASLAVLGVSFALAGVYAAILRSGRYIKELADAELVLDQITWTVVVYLSGGATSGAVSFYGLSAVTGAILTGMRGAGIAAFTGALCYALLVISLHLGWLLPPQDQPARLYTLSGDELVYQFLITLLVLVVVTLLAGYLSERLRITGGRLAEAEERAVQAERMAALGRLAAGLAHEIRNPLGSIAGSIQLLHTRPGISEEDRQLCEIIENEAERLNDLVTDMLDLSRPKKPSFAVVDAAQVAREVVALASKSGRGGSDVDVRFDGVEHALVRADGAQLRQLTWNLVRNAVQASSAGDAVRVTVELDDKKHVVLEVVDEGVGIDEAAMDRLFDAFFTTRSKGTGVGLAVVKRISDEHGFRIDVTSAEGRGANFRVDMGAAVEAADRTNEADRVAAEGEVAMSRP